MIPVEQALRVQVRQASARDVNAVIELRLALLHEHPDHAIYGRLRSDVRVRARSLFLAQLRADGEAIFLAEIGNDAIGILRCVESLGSPLMEPARYAYISSVFVREEYRRHGVLHSLMTAAEGWARARGLEQMRLHNVAGSESAEGAWGALGFEVVEQVRVRNLRPPGH